MSDAEKFMEIEQQDMRRFGGFNSSTNN